MFRMFRLFKAAGLLYLPLFPHLIKFLAKTVQFNTTCKDYDSIDQHSHQSTRTTGVEGGRGANHDHAQGGGGGATLEHIYIYIHEILLVDSHGLEMHLQGNQLLFRFICNMPRLERPFLICF